jgi:predicted DNA-binding transcriptional regulator AlpA
MAVEAQERALLRIPEAAAILGLDPKSTYEPAAAGKFLDVVRLGRRVWMHRDMLFVGLAARVVGGWRADAG